MRALIILFLFIASHSFAQPINTEVYKALSDSTDSEIRQQIELLTKDSSSSQSKAYLGALYMKEAAYLNSVSKKINKFKEGKRLLEYELANDSINTEYHFLRFIIQENAPSILKYNKNLKEDLALIYEQYGNLNAELKRIILNYSRSSSNMDTELLIP